MMKELHLPPVISWKKWVTNSMMRRKRRLYSGIPRDKTDVGLIQDLSVYEDYCMNDVFHKFDPRTASCSYRKCEGSWRTAAGFKGPKAQYLEQFYPVAKLLNRTKNIDEVNRTPTSFPLSVNNTGRFMYNTPSNIESNHTSSNIICFDAANENSNDSDLYNLASPTYKMGDVITEKALGKDHSGYHYYEDQQTELTWTDSYHYLMSLLSRRMEMNNPNFLQKYVRRMEKLFFDQEIEYSSEDNFR